MPDTSKPVDFLIVTPLEEERDAILSLLDTPRQLPPDDEDNRVYFQSSMAVQHEGKLRGKYRIVVVPLVGMGTGQASATTSDAIRRWSPRYMFVVGIAGGVRNAGVALGDVLVASQIADYTLQKHRSEKPVEIRWQAQPVDTGLLERANNFLSNEWVNAINCERPVEGQPKRHIGPIASGDHVVASEKLLAAYSEPWPKLIGVEMEAAGIARVAFQSKQQAGFFMVRGVSDLADPDKDSPEVENWRTYACEVAAAYAPLREILWSSQIDSLPEEVRESESFRWLLRRDGSRSRRANFEHDEQQDEDYRRLFRRLSESGECDRQTLSRLLKPIANTLLAPVLQSRYQRAIDIGMRWRNARNRHRWTRNSKDPENFEMTVAVNLKGLEARGTYVGVDELRTGFSQFLRDAEESADQELREVQAEWRRWEQQVANLREDATAVDNELNDLEPTSALIYAWLRFSIIRESYGSSERMSAFETGPLFFTLIVSMFAGRKRGLHPDFEFAFRHIDHVFHTMNDEIRYGAARRRQLARLEQKYETQNPFDAYAPLRRPADEELIRLVDEHTLVDRQPSPFLQQWRERLTEPPFWSGHYSDPMPFSKKGDSKSLERTADWADSLIKRKIGAVNRSTRDEVRPHGWETVSDCCRRIWINDWVMWIINNLTPREKKSVDARWTKDAVFEFVESVRTRLVSQGYSFDALSDDEKARLWKS